MIPGPPRLGLPLPRATASRCIPIPTALFRVAASPVLPVPSVPPVATAVLGIMRQSSMALMALTLRSVMVPNVVSLDPGPALARVPISGKNVWLRGVNVARCIELLASIEMVSLGPLVRIVSIVLARTLQLPPPPLNPPLLISILVSGLPLVPVAVGVVVMMLKFSVVAVVIVALVATECPTFTTPFFAGRGHTQATVLYFGPGRSDPEMPR